MAIVLKRLQGRFRSSMSNFGGDLGDFLLDETHGLSERLPTRLKSLGKLDPAKKRAAIRLLVEEDSSLVLEYHTTRALLLQTLSAPSIDEEKSIRLINRAIKLADILCVNDIGRINKSTLEEHLAIYEAWLNPSAAKKTTPTNVDDDIEDSWFNGKLQWLNNNITTENTNPYRLLAVRVRRLIVLSLSVINDFGYNAWILWADLFLAPTLAYLNLLFFLPRLISCLTTLNSHITDEEKELGYVRCNAQWNRLWPNVTNDFAWAINGAFMCFIFIGSLRPFGIYFSVAMQLYDVLMTGLRAHFELYRLDQLTLLSEAILEDDYTKQLEKEIQCEKNRLYFAFINAWALLLGMSLALPTAVAIHPLLPIIGAVIAVITTLVNGYLRDANHTKQTGFTSGLHQLLGKGRTPAMTIEKVTENPVIEVETLPKPVDQVVTNDEESFIKNPIVTSEQSKLDEMLENIANAPAKFIRLSKSCPEFNEFSFKRGQAQIFKPINAVSITPEKEFVPASPLAVTHNFSGIIRQDSASFAMCKTPKLIKQYSGSGYGFYHCDSPESETMIRASSSSFS